MTFSLTPEKWYALRDDRTNRLISENLENDNFIGVYVDPHISESYALQCMTLLTCNNLARWCRKIIISVPNFNQTAFPNLENNFQKLLEKSMNKTDPYGNFIFRDFHEDEPTVLICIGNGDKDFSKPYFWIDGSGWIGGVGYGTNHSIKRISDKNPIGPAFASWMGSAILFNFIMHHSEIIPFLKYYSLFDFSDNDNYSKLVNPPIKNSLDFGNMCQIGCGAVGSSFDYLLSLTDFKGNLSLIDFDVIEYENCNNTPAFCAQDKDSLKVTVCERLFNLRNIEVTSHPITYTKFSQKNDFSKYDPDVILCFANEQNIWTSIQNIIPPIVLSASTTPNWATTSGRHIPFKEWCVVCAYYHLINKTFTGKCGTGEIIMDDKIIVGNLPFLAPCAATFVLADVIRLNTSKINKINNISFSLKYPFNLNVKSSNPKRGCICQNQHKDNFVLLRKNTKFFD